MELLQIETFVYDETILYLRADANVIQYDRRCAQLPIDSGPSSIVANSHWGIGACFEVLPVSRAFSEVLANMFRFSLLPMFAEDTDPLMKERIHTC